MMGVSLSIKGVPQALAERLRRRAAANHRSLQRELLAIIEAAAAGAGTNAVAATARESEGRYAADAAPPDGADDGLLAELDAIVAGSAWGQAPLLTREEANDRELTRELDLDARAQELAQARQRTRRGAAK
jgi:plasmid stability protein